MNDALRFFVHLDEGHLKVATDFDITMQVNVSDATNQFRLIFSDGLSMLSERTA